jgi:hypothetical protein
MAKTKPNIDRVRRQCIKKALDEMYVEDHISDPKGTIDHYVEVCKSFEKKHNLDRALSLTIVRISEDNFENDDDEVDSILVHMYNTYDRMMNR